LKAGEDRTAVATPRPSSAVLSGSADSSSDRAHTVLNQAPYFDTFDPSNASLRQLAAFEAGSWTPGEGRRRDGQNRANRIEREPYSLDALPGSAEDRQFAARFARGHAAESGKPSFKNGVAPYIAAIAVAVSAGAGCGVYFSQGEAAFSTIATSARAAVAAPSKANLFVPVTKPDGPEAGQDRGDTDEDSWTQTLDLFKSVTTAKAPPQETKSGDMIGAWKMLQKTDR
jgi:hypothetical protein